MSRRFTPKWRKHASSTKTKFPLTWRQWSKGGHTFKFIFASESGDESLVICWSGQDVADTEVTWLNPFTPWHPSWGNQGLLPRHQDHIVDRDRISASRTHDKDSPIPTDICGVETGIEMGCYVIGVHHGADKFTYIFRANFSD
jgi:hypothetical protein